jgi:hypothetical protein
MLMVLALATVGLASAQVTYVVTVNTSSVSGQSGFIELQFTPVGASQLATATVSNFTTDGILGAVAPPVLGDVTGTLPGTLSMDNGTLIQDYFQAITFGNTITFVLTLGGPAVTAPNGNPSETVFVLSFLDSTQTNFILTNAGPPVIAAGAVDISTFFGTVTPTGFGFVTFSSPSMQVAYVSNLKAGDSFVNITNDGASDPAGATGTLCVNVYGFDQNEELLSCCTCTVTPNGLASLSVNNSLFGTTLTGKKPTSAVVELIATTNTGAACNAANVTAGQLAPGMRVWGTTLHALPGSGYGVTENPFSQGTLSADELAHLTSFCGFIQGDGSGQGVCSGCTPGAQ